MTFNEFAQYTKNNITRHLYNKDVFGVTVEYTNHVNTESKADLVIYTGKMNYGLSLDYYYRMYKRSSDIDYTIKMMAKKYNEITEHDSFKALPGVDDIYDQVIYRTVSYKENQATLYNVIHEKKMDLANMICIPVRNIRDEVVGVAPVTNAYLYENDLSRTMLIEAANRNTPNFLPATIKPLFSKKESTVHQIQPWSMYQLTNSEKTFGAGVVFYDGIMSELSKKSGGMDIVLLPASVHEWVIIPVPVNDEINIREFKNMVRQINNYTLPPEEFLSDNIYKYKNQTRELIILEPAREKLLREER